MEKEKKSRAVKKTNTAANQTGVQSIDSKKPAAKKKTAVVEMSANGIEPQKKTVAASNPADQKMTQMKISHDEIAKLAHRYWLERGGQHGSHAEDWLRAERELRGKAS
ncbi:MAG TPA: DUF2934 domain-containing protein [Terracidiphilus sp.]|jgi:Protein of unknown function (DUF2934)|nr:DUF2934 domain-containing protein [Terracidiphilus sp.]